MVFILVSRVMRWRHHYEFNLQLPPVKRGLRENHTWECTFTFCSERERKSHLMLVWTGMGMAPSAVSTRATSHSETLCPPVWVASARGGSRDRGLDHQSGVTWHLHQGLEVEASGWEEWFTAPLLVHLQCIKKALEERRCLQRLISAPSEEACHFSTGCRVWGQQHRLKCPAKPEGASTISKQSDYGSHFIFFCTLISFSGLFLLSTWQSHLRPVPAASPASSNLGCTHWSLLPYLIQCLSIKTVSVYQLYNA